MGALKASWQADKQLFEKLYEIFHSRIDNIGFSTADEAYRLSLHGTLISAARSSPEARDA